MDTFVVMNKGATQMTPGRAPEPRRVAPTLAESGIAIAMPRLPVAPTLAALGEPLKINLAAMRSTWRENR